MKKIVSILFLVLFSVSFSFSQMTDEQLKTYVKSASSSEMIQMNSRMLIEGNFHQSVFIANRLLEIDSENSNYNYRKGFALLQYKQGFEEAKPLLIKAVSNVSKNHDLFSSKESRAPIDSYYYLARCYHLAKEIDLAKKYFNIFLESATKKDPLIPKAELALKQCDVAKVFLAIEKDYEVINLGPQINTKDPEYAPAISLDGQALYYTSRRLRKDSSNIHIKEPMTNMYLEDIYVSFKNDEGEWSDAELLDFCLPERNDATVAVSSDERRIYVYRDDEGNGDIFYSDFEDGRFKEVSPVDIEGVNTESWEPHITVSLDGKAKYFSSDRPGGFGGRDLYRIVKLPDGSWSLPQNLGPSINSEHDEDAPFIALDNKTLYFSSNGEKSMGGFDIFISVLDAEGQWSDPINLGYPLNSMSDDIYYTTTADGKLGYMSSYRPGGYGEKDIYEVQNDLMGEQHISLLKGEIVIAGDKLFPEDLSVTINCLDCDQLNVRTVYPRVRDGKFFSTLPKCHEYELIFKHGDNDEEFHRDIINTNCEQNYEEINHRTLLDLDNMKMIPFMKYNFFGDIADFSTKEFIENAKVELFDQNGSLIETHQTDADGAFKSKILDDKFYGNEINFTVKVTKEDYITQKFTVNKTLGEDPDVEVHYLIDIPEIGKDITEVLELNPIYFDLDKSNIRPDAAIELDKIVEIMNDNPSIHIELGSHTDCRGSAKYNLALSDRRAKSSAAYIKKRIDDPSRISGKGYGESKLVNHCECEGDIVSDCTEEQHQANRRTEFRIVE